jgi:COP9 signalosome complex subunit 1
LAEHEADYLMDIYLARHVKELFGLIRRKCIVQYFIPFSCVTLQSLDEVFASNGQSIEKELVGMIRDGSLNARIDAKSKVGCHGTHKTITY